MDRKPLPSIHRKRGIVRTEEDSTEAFVDIMEIHFQLNIDENDHDDQDENIEAEVKRLRRIRGIVQSF